MSHSNSAGVNETELVGWTNKNVHTATTKKTQSIQVNSTDSVRQLIEKELRSFNLCTFI